jgi:hypothetical protein
MKRIILLLLLIISLESCSKKNVKLPETHNLDITEIKDVSPAYVFYDETKKDSVELNRKNLIITTNWLVNVDKRLTLRQAIPSITFLQNKKRNAKMHKNENAKNYFSCFNPDIKNLAFIEFTDIVYSFSWDKIDISRINIKENSRPTDIMPNDSLYIYKNFNLIIESLDLMGFKGQSGFKMNQLTQKIDSIELLAKETPIKLYLIVNEKLNFQDYITLKSLLLNIEKEDLIISKNEAYYN